MAKAADKARGRRRSGGRSARKALRAAGSVGEAVRPGQEGGAFRPLSARDIGRIADTAFEILERIGIAESSCFMPL